MFLFAFMCGVVLLVAWMFCLGWGLVNLFGLSLWLLWFVAGWCFVSWLVVFVVARIIS